MIDDYLQAYWAKYPKEALTDPSLESVYQFLQSGGGHFCQGRLLGLYVDEGPQINLLVYWCDLEGLSLQELKDTVKLHKSIITKFNKPVVSKEVKPVFNRGYLGHYDNNLWRWL